MSSYTLNEVEQLVIKLKQHEEIIIQLLEIIASTNRKVADLANSQMFTVNDNIH